jgi:hypothetical protein
MFCGSNTKGRKEAAPHSQSKFCVTRQEMEHFWTLTMAGSAAGLANGHGLDDKKAQSSSPGKLKNSYRRVCFQ